MKPEQTQVDQIRTAFEKMQSREDLLQLLNEAKPMVYGQKAVPFDLKQLTWFSNPKVSGKHYVDFEIKKKSGSPRTIHAPVAGLKAVQKTLGFILQCVFEPHKAAYGFVRSKSIVDNARLHEGNHYVYNIDLKDFFPSVDQARVWKCLQLPPFNLVDDFQNTESDKSVITTGLRTFNTVEGERIFYKINEGRLTWIADKKGNFKKYKTRLTKHLVRPDVKILSRDPEDRKKLREYNDRLIDALYADTKKYFKSEQSIKSFKWLISSRQNIGNIIASLCCTEMEVERKNETGEWEKVTRNVLPQGAPTSPVITNIICQKLDRRLEGVAKRFGLKYSRYADDVTFSSMHNVYQPESDFLKELQRIISEQDFHIKESKTRLQKKVYRQEVTGLLVNEKVNVQQRYIKELRMWLNYWERYGYERAYSFFLQQYMADKGNLVKGKPDMANVIGGKLDYLKMVKGADNTLHHNLKARFDKITGKMELAVAAQTDLHEMIKRKEQLRLNPLLEDEKVKKLPSKKERNAEVPERNLNEDLVQEEEKIHTAISHDATQIPTFLNAFMSDPVLKYTLHFYDNYEEDHLSVIKTLFEYEEFMKEVEERFKMLTKKYKISTFLWSKFNAFLLENGKTWSGKNIAFSWRHPLVINWCRQNQGKWPNCRQSICGYTELEFPDPLRFGSSIYRSFNEIITEFKLGLQFRNEPRPNDLLSLIKKENIIVKPEQVEFDYNKMSEGVQFYADVEKVMQAYRKLISVILAEAERIGRHYVEFELREDKNGKIYLTIFNKGVEYGKSFSSLIHQLKTGSGDTVNPVKNLLQNVCDWRIEARFPNELYRSINILRSVELSKYDVMEIDSVDGVKHILTFYRSNL